MAAEEPPSAIRQRIDFIDGLRAIAVLSVVGMHALTSAVRLTPGSLPYRVVVNGSHGVDLFFVISGFCLSYPTLRKAFLSGYARFDVGEFFTRRVVRIVPPYWCAVAVCLASIALYRHAGLRLFHGLKPPGSISDLVGQLFFVRHDGWILGVFWTLQVEFLWYIVFPLCLTLWIKSPKLFVVAALLPHPIGMAVRHFMPHLANYFSFWMMLLPFMSGIVAADVFLRKPAWAKWALPAFIATMVFALWFQWKPVSGWTHTQLSWQIASFLLVVAGGTIPEFVRGLSIKPLVSVGVASYSIYLVHSLAVHAPMFHRHGIALGFVSIASGIAAGFAFWFLFERPVTETPLRDKLWAIVGKVVRPSLAWWKLPAFGGLPSPAKV